MQVHQCHPDFGKYLQAALRLKDRPGLHGIEGGPERQIIRSMPDDTQFFHFQPGANTFGIHPVGTGGGRLQSQVKKIKTKVSGARNLFEDVARGVIHQANLHSYTIS